jgi:penicillin amidase
MPFTRDPPEGTLASANDRPPPEAGVVGYFFSDGDRVGRLRALLAARPVLSPTDLMRIQSDTRSPKAAQLAAALLARLDALPGGAPKPSFLAPLRDWDGNYAVGARAPVAFEFLLAKLVPQLLPEQRRAGGKQPRGAETGWSFLTTFTLPDLDALPPLRRQAILHDAVAAAARNAAPYVSWGEVHRMRATNWLVNLPVIGSRFVVDRWPVGGSRETPMKTSHDLVSGPHDANFGSMARHVSDMSDPDANWFTLLGGEDGWLGSPAYADQLPLWRAECPIRVPLRPATVAAEFRRITILAPGR